MPLLRPPNRLDKLLREIDPCSFCGANRWKTLIKGAMWRCRNCGAVREPDMAL